MEMRRVNTEKNFASLTVRKVDLKQEKDDTDIC